MNKLENSVIKYQIDLERYKNGQANEIISLFDKADAEIARFLKETKGVYTKARYHEIASKLREISKTLKENIEENTDIDGLIDYSLAKEKKLLELARPYIKKTKEGEINFLYPSREQIKTAALFKPASDSLTYQSYLNGIESGLFNVWDSAVRTGYLTGQTTQQIVKNVMGGITPETKLRNAGVINSLRNSVYGNTRTLLQSFAEETRERVYAENEQYFGDGEYKYEYLATLDNRTCIVCGECGGKLYKKLEDVPHIPQHRGCRCILLPYFNIDGDKTASKNGYVDNVSFEDWLKVQDKKTQIDVLGVTRYKLFQDGTKIEQFVDNGQTLTLAQLSQRGIIDLSGASFGGILDKSEEEQNLFAESYYKEIENRKSKSDIKKISINTGFSKEKIAKVRNHLFENKEHIFEDGSKGAFSPNAHIALAWQRLEQGNFNKNDILLLNHEYVELSFIEKKGYNYSKAHWLSNLRYPWEFKIIDRYKGLSNAEIHEIVRNISKDYL